MTKLNLILIIVTMAFAGALGEALHSREYWKHQYDETHTQLLLLIKNDKKRDEVYDELERENDAVNQQLANDKRVRIGSVCTTIKTTSERSKASTERVDADGDGVDTATLLDFAAKAEHYRLQLIQCQQWNK